MDDPYAVLGLGQRAGKAEIKTAYRALAKVWHPDRHRGDPVARERFVEISEAYRILISDGGKDAWRGRMPGFAGRRARSAAKPGPKAGTPASGSPRAEVPEPTDDEMMERIFGVAPSRRTIDDAPSLDTAADAGTEPQTEASGETDAAPHGRTVLLALNALFGRRGGRRKEDEKAEAVPETLKAAASVPLRTVVTGGTVEVSLPDGRQVIADIDRGIGEGTVLVLPPELHATEAPVEITVYYARSETFWWAGSDVHTTLAVGLETAVLGGQENLDTLDGAIRLTIPPWSGSDRTLRVGGRGLPCGEDERGDLLVHLRVMLPETADPRLIELMKQRQEGFYV